MEKICEETNEDGSVTATYFGKEFQKTGFLGGGPEKQTGAVLFIETIPKARIDRDGRPPERMSATLYNLDAWSDLLGQMGITEEWLQLPDGIDSVEDLIGRE